MIKINPKLINIIVKIIPRGGKIEVVVNFLIVNPE
jgi:hypothetical protein